MCIRAVGRGVSLAQHCPVAKVPLCVVHHLQHLCQVALGAFQRHRAQHDVARVGCDVLARTVVPFTPVESSSMVLMQDAHTSNHASVSSRFNVVTGK